MHVNRTLKVQAVIVSICVIAVIELAANFPFPSPLIQPFLPPKERWPDKQIVAWVEMQKFDPAFVDYFYRDPERVVPAGANSVSPADGVVKATLYDDTMSELVVGLSFWDVHVVRTPVSGTVKSIVPAGKIDFRQASEWSKTPLGNVEPEPGDDVALRGKDAPVQAVITVATSQGDVKIRMITSYWASRVRVWVHEGDHLEKGQRIGRILLGSTVAAAFPPGVHFSARPKQRVVAGETIIVENSD